MATKTVWYGLTVTLLPEHSGEDEGEHRLGMFFDRWYPYILNRRFGEDEYFFEFPTKSERNKCYTEGKRLMVFGLERWKRVLEK
jgi:hypothetical protein